jgi:hypothetical protein
MLASVAGENRFSFVMFGLKAAPPAHHGGIEAIQSWRLDAQHLGHLFRKVGIALFHERLRVLPRRWVVERTFAWLNRCRRLARL